MCGWSGRDCTVNLHYTHYFRRAPEIEAKSRTGCLSRSILLWTLTFNKTAGIMLTTIFCAVQRSPAWEPVIHLRNTTVPTDEVRTRHDNSLTSTTIITITITTTTNFMDQAMLALFRPLEVHVGPCILTEDVLYFVFISGFMLQFSSEFAYLSFVECDVSTATWIVGFYYLD